jgi:peptidoglycan-N-acetylglucosamine deacetylase
MIRPVLACAALTLLVAAAGCASNDEPVNTDAPGEASSEGTDNDYSEDDIISEGQLYGRDLPAKQIALTFDDGPGERTSELSTYLKNQGIPAAFFVNGKNVPGRQRVLTQMIADGHIVANHTQNHLKLTSMSTEKAVDEITRTDNFIKEAQPGGPWLLRPPFGAWSPGIARAANATSLSKYVGSVFWDIGGEVTATSGADWACWGSKYRYSPAKCGDLYMQETRRRGRGIVLLHDIHSATVDMVKLIVPKLKAEGYSFVKVTDVPNIAAKITAGPQTPDTCFSSTLRKNVPEGSCVQSARDSKWYRCNDQSWVSVASGTDAACKSTPR